MRLGEPRAVASFLVAWLALVACGDDGAETAEADDPRRPQAVEIMVTHFRSRDTAGVHFTQRESQCLADDVVQALGVERLETLGMDRAAGAAPVLTTPPLTTAEAESILASMVTCASMPQRLAYTDDFDALPQSDANCVAAAYFDSGMAARVYFADDAHQPTMEEISTAFHEAAESCGIPALWLVPKD